MNNFSNQIKGCTMEVLVETYKLCKCYRNSSLNRIAKQQHIIARCEEEFNLNPTLENKARCNKWEDKLDRTVRELSETLDNMRDIKYEMISRI